MKKKPLLFIICCLFVFSCDFTLSKAETKKIIFDKVAFSNAKQKWQEQKLTDYTFKYTFNHRAGLPELAIGEVIVSDNTGTINKLRLHTMHKDGEDFYYPVSHPKDALDREKGNDGGKRFYEEVQKIEDSYGYTIQLKTVDEIFDLIEQRLLHLHDKCDTDSTINRCELLVSYNAQTGVPETIAENIYRTTDPKPSPSLVGWSNRYLDLKISNFNTN